MRGWAKDAFLVTPQKSQFLSQSGCLLGGPEQVPPISCHTCFILGPGVPHGPHRVTQEGRGRTFPRLQGEPSPVSPSFPGSRPPPPRHSRQAASSTCDSDPPASPLRGSWEDAGPRGTQGRPLSAALTPSHLHSHLPREVTCPQVPGPRMGTTWGWFCLRHTRF